MGAGFLSDDPNSFALYDRAAVGDLEVQRRLASEAMDCLDACDLQGFYGGLTFARLAAAQGGEEDTGLLIYLLAAASNLLPPDDVQGRACLAGETIARAFAMTHSLKGEEADHFDAVTQALVDGASPDELAWTHYFQDQIKAARAGGK